MNGENWPPFSIDHMITNRNVCGARRSTPQHLKLTSGIQLLQYHNASKIHKKAFLK
jgi:hypothetical protein